MAGFGYQILGFGSGGGVSPQTFDYQFIAGGGSGNRNQHGGGGGGGRAAPPAAAPAATAGDQYAPARTK